jgi:hypothetical protein
MTSQEFPRPLDERAGEEVDPALPQADAEAEDPEQFAEEAGIDPTSQEVDEYLKLADRQAPWSGA